MEDSSAEDITPPLQPHCNCQTCVGQRATMLEDDLIWSDSEKVVWRMSAPGEVAHCQAMERQLLAAQRPSAHARWGKEGPPLRCWRSLPAGTRAPAWRLLLPVLAAAAGEAQPACRDMHLTTHTRMVLPLSVIQLQENVPCTDTIQLPETHSHREGIIHTGTGVIGQQNIPTRSCVNLITPI